MILFSIVIIAFNLNAFGQVNFSDDFESGNFTTGGWQIYDNPQISTQYPYSGSYCVKGPAQWWLNKSFLPINSNIINIEFAMKADQTGTNACGFYVKDGNQEYSVVVYISHSGYIVAFNGANVIDLLQYSPNVWYQVKIVLNMQNRYFDVYINGILKANNFQFKDSNFDKPEKFWWGSGESSGVGWLDDVSINTPNSSGLNFTFNQIDASGFPLIKNYVTISDNSGNPISGLNASNFIVKENGYTESPISVNPIGGGSSTISVALVIDRSGSMGGNKISDAKTAAITFVNQMSSNDKAAIISFSTDVTVDQTFTNDKSSLINAINNINTGGSTSVYDAVIESVNQVATQSGRKAIILLTDGLDNNSSNTIDDAVNIANQVNVPIFSIGLGISSGSQGEQNLQYLSQNTGGRYYNAPNSSDLQQIYQLIAQQLQNQYLITYTTHNQTHDGSTRTVDITASYQGSSANASKIYVAPSGSGGSVPIVPVSNSIQNAGSDFWVEINVGSSIVPVTDLFGVSFVLTYNASYLNVVTPYSSNVVYGSLMGSDLVFYQTVDQTNSTVSVGVSKKSGQSGSNGYGTVARIKFHLYTSTPDQTQLVFTLNQVSANNSGGGAITLNPATLSITANAGITVWPGDTNNDGIVNQADVLPVGLNWQRVGPSRTNASLSWNAQICQPWNPESATYADATGDGIVNQGEIQAIGLNWHKTHSLFKTIVMRSVKGANSGVILPVIENHDLHQEFYTFVDVKNVSNLFGVSFVINYPSNQIDVLSVENGDFFGNDAISYSNIDAINGKVNIGISRKAGQPESNGSGTIVKIKMKTKQNVLSGTSINITLGEVSANDSEGNMIDLSIQNCSFITNVSQEKTEIPNNYELSEAFPNPFNPSTTISFKLPERSFVTLVIYNSFGQRIKKLTSSFYDAGFYNIKWNGTDDSGNIVSSGLYIYQIKAGNYLDSRKVLLMR